MSLSTRSTGAVSAGSASRTREPAAQPATTSVTVRPQVDGGRPTVPATSASAVTHNRRRWVTSRLSRTRVTKALLGDHRHEDAGVRRRLPLRPVPLRPTRRKSAPPRARRSAPRPAPDHTVNTSPSLRKATTLIDHAVPRPDSATRGTHRQADDAHRAEERRDPGLIAVRSDRGLGGSLPAGCQGSATTTPFDEDAPCSSSCFSCASAGTTKARSPVARLPGREFPQEGGPCPRRQRRPGTCPPSRTDELLAVRCERLGSVRRVRGLNVHQACLARGGHRRAVEPDDAEGEFSVGNRLSDVSNSRPSQRLGTLGRRGRRVLRLHDLRRRRPGERVDDSTDQAGQDDDHNDPDPCLLPCRFRRALVRLRRRFRTSL